MRLELISSGDTPEGEQSHSFKRLKAFGMFADGHLISAEQFARDKQEDIHGGEERKS